LKISRKKFWIILVFVSLLLVLGFHVFRHLYAEKERQIRIDLRRTIKERYPEKAKALQAKYGIKPANGSVHKQTEGTVKPDVILVHGLDEPGKVWMNLAPVLINDGHRVWTLTYPNDQPIAESAVFFFEEMVSFREKGIKTTVIVAHSMGGLVAREMLSNPELAYMKNTLDDRVPDVAGLIMVGTPNHGSELARFRIFTEFRDQLSNLFQEDFNWLQGILDGAGEAGLDLIPGSPFLETLNSRPHPERVRMLVIAGVMGTGQTEDIEKRIRKIKTKLPENTHGTVSRIGDLLNTMAHGVGDGLVPVNSAKLDGVPLHIVQGTHLSMIRNISPSNRRIPPSVPIIKEYLSKEF